MNLLIKQNKTRNNYQVSKPKLITKNKCEVLVTFPPQQTHKKQIQKFVVHMKDGVKSNYKCKNVWSETKFIRPIFWRPS